MVYNGYVAGIGMTFSELVGNLGSASAASLRFGFWIPPIVLAVILIFAIWVLTSAKAWNRWRWRLPGFKEANLSQFASRLP